MFLFIQQQQQPSPPHPLTHQFWGREYYKVDVQSPFFSVVSFVYGLDVPTNSWSGYKYIYVLF